MMRRRSRRRGLMLWLVLALPFGLAAWLAIVVGLVAALS